MKSDYSIKLVNGFLFCNKVLNYVINLFFFSFYNSRSPECTDDHLVNVAAVDLRSIGDTAYGSLQSERVCSTQNFYKFIQAEGLLKLTCF